MSVAPRGGSKGGDLDRRYPTVETIRYLESFRPSIRVEPEPDFDLDAPSMPPARGSRARVRRASLKELPHQPKGDPQ